MHIFLMIRTLTIASILCTLTIVPLEAQRLNRVIDGVEKHYNSPSSLQMEFVQSMDYQGQQRLSESGMVFLQQPGRMRLDYTKPSGKFSVSDGEIYRLYNPLTHQVRQIMIGEVNELSSPLAFLLGNLRMRRMFSNLRLVTSDEKNFLVGDGHGEKDYFTHVEFGVDLETYTINSIKIFRKDQAVNAFEFTNEIQNPKLSRELFEFIAPEGADVLPLTPTFNEIPLAASPH